MPNMKYASERDAKATLATYWTSASLPVDPVKIARDMGVRVVLAQLGEDISGMIVKRPDEDATIYVDVDDSPKRQRFTVAHELGHYVERADDRGQLSYVDRRGGPWSLRELYANEFAGHLLMPADAFTRQWAEQRSLVSVANHFGVSQDAAEVRRRRLGLQ
ncbi:ImmA/IrrE family metallo-endopeptidase [Pseudokineococcus sp. 1T1Z-3]|uniref:ImmA/IrrE family metallo-endopeptidase n=1 Tax=Pseudokineococcus sp. 1T1Z-3 TaxID=3132745 RepID=UPI00309870C5